MSFRTILLAIGYWKLSQLAQVALGFGALPIFHCLPFWHPLMEPLTLCTKFYLSRFHLSHIMPKISPSLLGSVPCLWTHLSPPPQIGRSLAQHQLDTLLTSYTEPVSQSRMLGASSKESGAWLHAPPISSLGLRMSDDVVCTAIGLRVGAPICLPRTCSSCEKQVNELAFMA